MKTPRSVHFLMAISGLGLFTVSCAIFGIGEGPMVPGRPAEFPHSVHVGEPVEADCVECHVFAEDENHAGMPGMGLCLVCRTEELDAGKPVEQTPAGFVLAGEETPTWTTVTATTIDTRFSHSVHYEAEIDCLECHVGIADSGSVGPALRTEMSSCIECHEARGVADGGCQSCHPGLDARTRPASHEGMWVHQHGSVSTFFGMTGGPASQQCALCHTESSCANCHARTAPDDHTEPWRLRGHGFAAMLERDRCITCHREDSCARCHARATPVTHGGIWGGRTSAHCMSCHEPLGSDDSCYVCHRSARSHRSASRIPGGGHPGPNSDCRECHTTLTHFDNGQECTLCHR